MLVALAALAGHWSGVPLRTQARWYAVVFACFVVSHLLGLAIGAWPAVAVATLIASITYRTELTRARVPAR